MMDLIALQNKLSTYKKGTFVKVVWEKEVSSAKARKQGITVIKRCEGVVRAGITYANIALVKEILSHSNHNNDDAKKESWFEHIGNGIVQHKKDSSKKYLQLFFVNSKKIKSTFKISGLNEELSGDKLYEEGLITKADLPKQVDEPMLTMTVSLDHILSFGN